MFTFEQLRSFVVLSEELHFGRAAERLNMTQPPLSRQIQRLEKELGFALFVRSQRKVEITRAGELFAEEARKLLTMAEASNVIASRIAAGAVGHLRVGITASAALALLGHILQRLEATTPGLEVSVDEMVSRDQINAVEKGALDLVFVRTHPHSPELESLLVFEEPLVAAISSRHPLAVTSRPLNPRELEGETVLQYTPAEAEYFRTLAAQALTGVQITPKQQLTQIHMMIALVAANQGIALVPESVSRLGMPGVVYRSLTSKSRVTAQLLAVWRRDNSNPAFPAARLVLQEMHSKLSP